MYLLRRFADVFGRHPKWPLPAGIGRQAPPVHQQIKQARFAIPTTSQRIILKQYLKNRESFLRRDGAPLAEVCGPCKPET